MKHKWTISSHFHSFTLPCHIDSNILSLRFSLVLLSLSICSSVSPSSAFIPPSVVFIHCKQLHNSYVYPAWCCPTGWNVTVVFAPPIHTQAHKNHAAFPRGFLAHFCFLLFSFALPWSLDSSASVLSQASPPRGLEWMGELGKRRRNRKTIRKQKKEEERVWERENNIISYPFNPFSF